MKIGCNSAILDDPKLKWIGLRVDRADEEAKKWSEWREEDWNGMLELGGGGTTEQ